MDAHGMTKLQPGSAVERLGKRTRLGCALLDKSCHFELIISSTGAGDAKALGLKGSRSRRFTLAMTAMRLSQHSSIPLNDKNCLIVDSIFLANLSQTIVSFESVFEQRIAYVFCRQQVVLAHDVFKLLSFLLVASAINPVGVKEENVPWTHQR